MTYENNGLIQENNTAAHELQIRSEELAVGRGITRYLNNEAKRPGSLRNPSAELIRRHLKPLTAAIVKGLEDSDKAEQFGRCKPSLERFSPEELALTTLNTVFDEVEKGRTKLVHIGLAIGSRLNHSLRFAGIKGETPGIYKSLIKRMTKEPDARQRKYMRQTTVQKFGMDDQYIDVLDRTNRARCGSWLLWKLIGVSDLFEGVEGVRNSGSKVQTPYHVTLSEAGRKWMEDRNERVSSRRPMYMPMIAPPEDWAPDHLGGHYTAPLKAALVRRRHGNNLSLGPTSAPSDLVFATVNRIQAVAWRVNSSVFQVALEVWEDGGGLGMPNADPDVMPAWRDDATDLEKRQLMMLRKLMHRAEKLAKEKRVKVATALGALKELDKEEKIYFPHNFDSRGRLYPISTKVSYQQEGIIRACLEFAEGKPLGDNGAYWLAVHLANSFGNDKLPLVERVQFVQDNHENIIDSAMNPLDGERWWLEADEPYMTLAACKEWLGYTIEGDSFVSHLPIAMDGTCSGLQHYSALLRDPIGAELVNLCPGERKDIYQTFADKMNQMFLTESDPEFMAMARVWRDKFLRKFGKDMVMTYVYGSKQNTRLDKLFMTIKDMDRDSGDQYLGDADLFAACCYANRLAQQVLREIAPKATEMLAWFAEIPKHVLTRMPQGYNTRSTNSKAWLEANKTIDWVTPAGFPVYQFYPTYQGGATSTFIGPSGVPTSLSMNVPMKYSFALPGKNRAALAPNYIHGNDAAHLMLTADRCFDNGITAFGAIHDSFATHACDVPIMNAAIRETFIEMYSVDQVQIFLDQIRSQVSEEVFASIPPPPEMGDFDLSKVLESDFFFS